MAETIDYARKSDPPAMHIDEQAATTPLYRMEAAGRTYVR